MHWIDGHIDLAYVAMCGRNILNLAKKLKNLAFLFQTLPRALFLLFLELSTPHKQTIIVGMEIPQIAMLLLPLEQSN